MYYKAFAAALLLLITLCAFRCNKSSDYIGGDIYTAEIKQITSCARFYACVITEGDIDPGLVDNKWEHDGQIYSRAFVVQNNCEFPARLKAGASFRFRILKKQPRNNCEVCMIGILGAPSKNLSVKVIE